MAPASWITPLEERREKQVTARGVRKLTVSDDVSGSTFRANPNRRYKNEKMIETPLQKGPKREAKVTAKVGCSRDTQATHREFMV